MMNKRLYTRPYITAGVFLLAGVVLICLGFWREDANMNNYALGAFGLLFLIVALVTFILYSRLEKQYRRLLREEPLLRYVLRGEKQKALEEKNIRELREKNKAILMVMLFFCVMFAIILPFFVEEKFLMIGICLGLGAFLALAAWVITAYRVRKLRRGGEEVILGRGGAYVAGAFHAWDMPETGITGLDWTPSSADSGMGQLNITYTAQTGTVPLDETIVLLVPPELEGKIPGVLRALEAHQVLREP